MNKILVVGLVGESVFMKCDHFHQEGETIRVKNIYTEIGGKGYNQALTIKTLGGNVSFVCALGVDSTKDYCLNEMNKMNMDYHYFLDDKNKTAYANILTDKNGNNQVSVYPGAKLYDENIEEIYRLIDDATYILLQLEIPYNINLKIAKYAKALNKTVILNPAPAQDIQELLQHVDIITPNEIEAVTLFGEDYKHVLLNKHFKTIVTRGKKPTLLIDNDIKEYPVEKVKAVDTTGAGDVFNGALVYYLSIGKTLEYALIEANKVASKTVQYNYVLPGILNLKKD